MKVAELSPLDRHLRVVRTIGAHRPSVPDYAAYERMKADLVRDFLWRAIKWRSIQLARFVWAYEREERKQ